MLRGTPEPPDTPIAIYIVVARREKRMPLYVGQAKDPRVRFRMHLSNWCDSQVFRGVIRSFREARYSIEQDIVCWCRGRDAANRAERRLIARLRAHGFKLANRALLPGAKVA